MFYKFPAAALLFAMGATAAGATPAEVRSVTVDRQDSGWRFEVTLFHDDTGWADYADAWRLVTGAGAVLGTRRLMHPHINEQPFTRSLSNVAVPPDIDTVFVQTSTSSEGWAEGRHAVPLPD